MDDVTLTFDPKTFQRGIDAIAKGIEQMNNKFDEFGKKSTKAIQKSGLSAKNLVKSLAPIGAAFLTIKRSLKEIPEIGQTFTIASDIIMKQLLWPLRKELIPLLQKVLDWVRDHRATFLKWGQSIVSVFRIVKSVVTGAFDILKRFWTSLSGHLEKAFGVSVKSITDTTNLVLFKLSAIVEFLMALLTPLGSYIGDIFGTVIKIVKDFISEFTKGLGDLGPEIEQFISWIKEASGLVLELEKRTGILSKTFKILGGLLGGAVGTALRLIVHSLDNVLTGITKIPLAVDLFNAWRNKDVEEQKRLKKEMESIDLAFQERSKDRLNRTLDAWKSIGKGIVTTIKEKPDAKKEPKSVSKKTKKVESIQVPLSNNTTNNNNTQTNNRTAISKVNKVTKTNVNKSNSNSKITNDNRVTNNIEIKVEGSKDPEAVGQVVRDNLRDYLKEQQFRAGSR